MGRTHRKRCAKHVAPPSVPVTWNRPAVFARLEVACDQSVFLRPSWAGNSREIKH
ncbi:unnamed protein product [Ectocarpus sp. CCAP 1310/34]|nr:unnamed protein product [Ectocarpus sp. CCAP 1310/34]